MNNSTFQKFQNIQNKLDTLETQMNRIENKLDKLLKDFEILNELEPQCKKMSEHIDFVENVYDTVKSPMYYIFNKISKIRNITNGDDNMNNNKLLDK
jgi:septation ring formation regulator EzrA